jgi:hypothetical protein
VGIFIFAVTTINESLPDGRQVGRDFGTVCSGLELKLEVGFNSII